MESEARHSNSGRSYSFPSRYGIGQLVMFVPESGVEVGCHIRAVTFTGSKVRYALRLVKDQSTLHNVDSCLLKDAAEFEMLDMPPDNYS